MFVGDLNVAQSALNLPHNRRWNYSRFFIDIAQFYTADIFSLFLLKLQLNLVCPYGRTLVQFKPHLYGNVYYGGLTLHARTSHRYATYATQAKDV